MKIVIISSIYASGGQGRFWKKRAENPLRPRKNFCYAERRLCCVLYIVPHFFHFISPDKIKQNAVIFRIIKVRDIQCAFYYIRLKK